MALRPGYHSQAWPDCDRPREGAIPLPHTGPGAIGGCGEEVGPIGRLGEVIQTFGRCWEGKKGLVVTVNA